MNFESKPRPARASRQMTKAKTSWRTSQTCFRPHHTLISFKPTCHKVNTTFAPGDLIFDLLNIQESVQADLRRSTWRDYQWEFKCCIRFLAASFHSPNSKRRSLAWQTNCNPSFLKARVKTGWWQRPLLYSKTSGRWMRHSRVLRRLSTFPHMPKP